MGFEGLRRVRWGNVGRAVGAVALVAAVVAWPRLTSPAPRAPGGAVTPLAQPRPETRGEGSRRERAGRRERARPDKPGRRERRGAERTPEPEARPRAEAKAEAEMAPRAEPAPVATPPAAPRAAPDPAQTEFGFEGG
jgi:hypothetical protein